MTISGRSVRKALNRKNNNTASPAVTSANRLMSMGISAHISPVTAFWTAYRTRSPLFVHMNHTGIITSPVYSASAFFISSFSAFAVE